MSTGRCVELTYTIEPCPEINATTSWWSCLLTTPRLQPSGIGASRLLTAIGTGGNFRLIPQGIATGKTNKGIWRKPDFLFCGKGVKDGRSDLPGGGTEGWAGDCSPAWDGALPECGGDRGQKAPRTAFPGRVPPVGSDGPAKAPTQ